MTDVVLFHHAQGLTPGVQAFATQLEAAGHHVTVPDLYEGATFEDLIEGVAHAESIGFEVIVERGTAAVRDLPASLVYAGFSLGALPAQALAQNRPGALGALIYHGGVPSTSFGPTWPETVPLQIHINEGDEWSELDVVQELSAAAPGSELFVYPSSAHLVTDNSLPEYDAEISGSILARSLAFLARVG